MGLLLVASCQSSILVQPEPVPLGAAANDAQLRAEFVLAEQRWETVGRSPKELVAQRNEGDKSALVRLTFHKDTVEISYIDSWNLGYSNQTGEREIDSEYNSWVRRLANSLRVAFADPGA